jgi:hypothetical protein
MEEQDFVIGGEDVLKLQMVVTMLRGRGVDEAVKSIEEILNNLVEV